MIFSGLWGAVRLADRIPAYRCAVGVNLPGIGGLGTYWRTRDVRRAYAKRRVTGSSSIFAPAPTRRCGRRSATSSASASCTNESVDGVAKRQVVSHFNKATKGRIVRDLALAGARPQYRQRRSASALRDLKYTVEVTPGQLDVIVTEL